MGDKKRPDELPEETPSLESLSGLCSVLRSSLGPMAIAPIGRAISRTVKRPLSDITRQINASRGFLVRGIEADVARELAPKLEELGVDFFVVPDETIPDLPEAGRFSSGSFKEQGLACEMNLPDEWKSIRRAWKDVRLISCGRLSGEASNVVRERVGFLYSMDKIQTRVDYKYVIDILLRNPDERIRIDEDRPEAQSTGVRSEPLTEAHLVYLARQLFQFSADTPKSEGVKTLAFDGPAGFWENATFPTRHDFESYIQWLLQLLKYGKPLPSGM
ncbi:MAG: hypothetical protein GXP25_21195 [Planctomycetes bacterium]|nr:hypothetical protein [Planctomycetota bacterium]